MLFSEHFDITKGPEDDWFDPILDADTRIWVDPFLIFREASGEWASSHAEIIAHFQRCFDLIAQGGMQPHSLPYRKALALLTFKEPREFCLGYTESGTAGAGGGPGYARLIAAAMVEAIKRGLADLKHFEELGILEKGIGADRIADLTCNILKSRFIDYTKAVATQHNLPMSPRLIRNARFDPQSARWESVSHELPINPFGNRAVLLTPQRFLRDTPVLNPDAWFESYQNEQLRDDVSYELLTNVNKEKIVAAARQNPQAVRRWTEEQAKHAEAKPYDLEQDRAGVYAWDADTRSYAREHPLALKRPESEADFLGVIEEVIREFRRYIEQNRGWKLLWNDDGSEKREEAAQLAFLGIARSYCHQNDINIDREVELGRGPVDFKFSNGRKYRALLEIKKLTSGKFWQGLETQLPTYLTADDCDFGWYVAIRYRTGGISKTRGARLPMIIAKPQNESGKVVRFEMIDATAKPSASKA
jgi:hypothetical protein